MSHSPDFVQQWINNPPYWANNIMQPWNDDLFQDLEPFVCEEYWTGQGSVNVFNVIGTIHPDYQKKSWLHLLKNGKRMSLNQSLLESNPAYYQETTPKIPMMYFKTMDGLNYYISDDGNHRTCLARFYFYELGLTQLHGVTINHYKANDAFYLIYRMLLAYVREHDLAVQIKPKRSLIRRKDTAGWKTDTYETVLLWQTKNGCIEELNYIQSLTKYDALLKKPSGILSRIFG